MLKRKILSIGICTLFLLIVPGSFNPADSQTLSESKPAPDIGTWTQVPPGHSEVDLKGACMTCHNYKIDATTTATKQMVRNGKRMDKEQLWKHIVELLGGGKKTRTMVMSTSLYTIFLLALFVVK